MDYDYNPKHLRRLIKATGLTIVQLAEATGICEASLYQYRNGITAPGMSSAIVLARFFAVPLDVIIGNTSEENFRHIIENYGECFMKLRRAAVDSYIKAGQPKMDISKVHEHVEYPWPYNLYEAVVGKVERIITTEREADIELALKVLPERCKDYIYAYYKGNESFAELARESNFTTERARQIIKAGVRKLRTGFSYKLIRYGSKYCERHSELWKKERELVMQANELSRLETELRQRETMLKDELMPVMVDAANVGLDELSLSARAEHALENYGCKNLQDIIEAARKHKLHLIKNIGEKTVKELVALVYEMTGEDYSQMYAKKRREH
ncbi:helix-turn-helix domain-containing protein [Candidatus Saccharibacteria bacterium]|nr:helix-turn-helix domain-containing protein [Candidatus Saccharibacteria bacterium]